MAKCDLCNKTHAAHAMQELREIYRTDSVRDLCPTCMLWVEGQLDAIRNANAPELRRRISERFEKPKHRHWLLRWLPFA
jgi:hypothetical protein